VFIEQAKSRLKPGGMLLLEMESSQSEGIRKVIHASFPKAGITIIDDLNRLPRLAIIEN
jgi:methylase of polypeptide subunit release factors